MALQILIVDDSPAMRTFVKRVVQLSGLEVDRYLQAGNGAEALAILETENVDAVLTDINMPVMDGEELVRRMRANSGEAKSGGAKLAGKDTPIIVISTDATSHRIETLLSLGARGYVQKPFGPEQLRLELERVLGAQHA